MRNFGPTLRPPDGRATGNWRLLVKPCVLNSRKELKAPLPQPKKSFYDTEQLTETQTEGTESFADSATLGWVSVIAVTKTEGGRLRRTDGSENKGAPRGTGRACKDRKENAAR